MVSAQTTIQKFVAEQKRLLELELCEDEEQTGSVREKEADESRGGFLLRNTDVIDTSVGLYGRTVVSFGKHAPSQKESTNIYKGDKESFPDGENRASSSISQVLDAHRLSVGDEVEILPRNGKDGNKSKRVGGVICALDDFAISVAFDDKNQKRSNGKEASKKQNDDADDGSDNILGGPPPYTLLPRSGAEVHQKMSSALDELEKHGVNHPIAGNIILSAFEPVESHSRVESQLTRSRIEELERECNLESTRLDYSQREAVVYALYSESSISLIHGPPGTGKTTTVAELIRCAVHQKEWKVLVTAPSNVAVDNVLDRLMDLENQTFPEISKRKSAKKIVSRRRIRAVRLGHPARIQKSIQKYSLESLVQSSDGTEIVQDCRRELGNHLSTLSNPKSRSSDKRIAYNEMKTLRKEIRTREEKVVSEILRNANVILATNVGAAGSVFKRMIDSKGEPISFDLVIIDEAAQALEASCWISLLKGRRAVLAGDHKQLPPTIKSSAREVQRGLGTTLFERLIDHNNQTTKSKSAVCSKMLRVQYRMHEDIANWASNAMYGGQLVSHESVRHRKLRELPQIHEQLNSIKSMEKMLGDAVKLEDVTLTVIDTTGCGWNESTNAAGSRYNEGESELVISHVKALLSLGLQAQDIAVITPYNGQVELLRKKLLPEVLGLEIRSVDGFQGGEREAVVLSLVRSSENGGKDGIGFLRDNRRLNVAVTRARRHCAVICDYETVSKDLFIKNLIDWIEEKGDYHSGGEFVPLPNRIGSTSQHSDIQKDTVVKQICHSSKRAALVSQLISNSPAKCDPHRNGDTEEITPQNYPHEATKRESLINNVVGSARNGEEQALVGVADFDRVGLDQPQTDHNLSDSVVEESYSNISTSEKKSIRGARKSSFSQINAAVDDCSDEPEKNDNQAQSTNNGVQDGLLKVIAFERLGRQTENKTKSASKTPVASKSLKVTKKGGQKLGGGSKLLAKRSDCDDTLDDMAFLDSQIDLVQTSHGRRVEASGKGYKMIINGVLLAKNTPQEVRRTNAAASQSLQAKIKAKSDDRQLKNKKSNKD